MMTDPIADMLTRLRNAAGTGHRWVDMPVSKLKVEVARKGVTVNTVSPGYIDTALARQIRPDILEKLVAGIPVGRVGQPADIARAVAFLCADEAGYITGANLAVNGGLHMSA